MKVWVLRIVTEWWDEDYQRWEEQNLTGGVYSSPELAQSAVERAVTGKALRWCSISGLEPDDREVNALSHRETWYEGDVATYIHIYPHLLDADCNSNNLDIVHS